MKKIKYLGLLIMVALSFYFTDKIMVYMENQNPIMQEINSKVNLYRADPVNAIIKDNTIIPGVNGKEVDKRKSFLKMEDFGSFNETFLIYKNIAPDETLKDNLDKIIIKGNSIKRAVSFVLEENSKQEDYFIQNDIKYSIIANLDSDLTKSREYINGENESEKISDLHSLLNKNKINSNICLINYSNIDFCREKKYYIASFNIDMSNNITENLSNITSGSIILIRRNTSLDNLKLIFSEIKKQDLKIVYLSTLISENH